MSKTYKELQVEIERLQQEAQAVRKTELAGAIAEIKAKMAEFGITAKDLGNTSHATRRGMPVPPKYLNAATGETWSGRGKHPRWLASELANGRRLEDFAIIK